MMGNDEEGIAGEIRIKRTRRRVYEQTSVTPETMLPNLPQEDLPLPPDRDVRRQEARHLVRRYMLWSAGAGLAPVPLLDTVAVTAFQVRMLKRLCILYGLDYSGQRAKSVIASLVAGIHAGLITGSMVKLIPFLGMVSLAAVPAASGALTYAVGMVFIQHFESGGTFLNFDPVKVRKYFAEQYEKGRTITPADAKQ